MSVSRRRFLGVGGGMAGVVLAAPRLLRAQAASSGPAVSAAAPAAARSAVALVHGEDRRQNVAEALAAIEGEILPVLRQKKYVVVKPNVVSLIQPLAATHADALHGILDFLARHFKGEVVIAESSASSTFQGYEHFGYTRVPAEHPERKVTLVDLNDEGRYQTLQILDDNLHLQPVRLAARLLDPDAYVICSTQMKTHNAVVATLSVKNMALGAPLRSGPKESARWSDKRRYHVGIRQMHYNIMLTAQRMRPFWGATVIDGFEGMEGNGPNSGLPVPSRLAIASTDYIAADRVGLECMGINPEWVGYLGYCGQMGLGEYDLAHIDVRGAKIADVRKSYQLHRDIDRMLEWMGPLRELPPKLG
ncbi:MAG TPA: DUF362 domain-containing protein [Vicinamibacteria bacterium]|nr:DUF362 domain-containing protein [Vicinamibacteria bacterium]